MDGADFVPEVENRGAVSRSRVAVALEANQGPECVLECTELRNARLAFRADPFGDSVTRHVVGDELARGVNFVKVGTSLCQVIEAVPSLDHAAKHWRDLEAVRVGVLPQRHPRAGIHVPFRTHTPERMRILAGKHLEYFVTEERVHVVLLRRTTVPGRACLGLPLINEAEPTPHLLVGRFVVPVEILKTDKQETRHQGRPNGRLTAGQSLPQVDNGLVVLAQRELVVLREGSAREVGRRTYTPAGAPRLRVDEGLRERPESHDGMPDGRLGVTVLEDGAGPELGREVARQVRRGRVAEDLEIASLLLIARDREDRRADGQGGRARLDRQRRDGLDGRLLLGVPVAFAAKLLASQTARLSLVTLDASYPV